MRVSFLVIGLNWRAQAKEKYGVYGVVAAYKIVSLGGPDRNRIDALNDRAYLH